MIPLPFAETLPATEYTQINPKVFEESWQYIGPTLKTKGDYTTHKILNNPLLFIKEQETLGFHNVCRHHAATLLKGQGNCTIIRCPYHAWTYKTNGDLIGVPEFDGVENFKKEDHGLKPVFTQEIGPFLFANLSPNPEPYSLSPIGPGTAVPDVLIPYQFYQRKEYDMKCNWKVYVDNYLDGGYHVNSIHPDLAKYINYKEYKTYLYKNAVGQFAPLKDNPTSRSGSTAYYYWFFPNFMLNIYGNMMDTNLVLPTGDESCKVIMDFYKTPEVHNEDADESIIMSHNIQMEDVEICERVQEGLGSDSYDTGRYSVKRENGMYLFHNLLRQYHGNG